MVITSRLNLINRFNFLTSINILIPSIGLPSPPIEGLLSICAISLVHKDKELSELVIKELKKYEQDPTHGHHVAYLIAQYHLQNVRMFIYSLI